MFKSGNNLKRANDIRSKIVNLHEKKVLISKLKNSLQESDITLPVNCDGYGRIRHFRMDEYDDWVCDPLPNLPVAKALNIKPEEVLKAQVFQIAGCNWNCWYCFVDEGLRSCNHSKSKWFTMDELVELLQKERSTLKIIDLSGGQPDLVPEWILWMMESLEKFGLDDEIYLWSDDNLSTPFYWKFLSKKQRNIIANYKNYGKVCCFKGYDKKSFAFNTSQDPELFTEQFRVFERLLSENLDLYAYVTLTSPPNNECEKLVIQFVDSLQKIHDSLPLRTVPLKIVIYQPMKERLNFLHEEVLKFQLQVLSKWKDELSKRYSKRELTSPICDVSLC